MKAVWSLFFLFFILVSCTSSQEKAKNHKGAVPYVKAMSGHKQLIFSGKRSGEAYYSRDGQLLSFQSERDSSNPFYQIYVLNLKNGKTNRVSPGYGKTTCSWIHPNQEQILFSSTHLDPMARAKQKAELDFRASGKKRRYSWDYDENYEIFSSTLQGKKLKRLTRAKGYDAEGSYSPKGDKIAFASNRIGYQEKLSKEDADTFKRDPSFLMDIYIMDSDGKNLKRLTTSKGYDGGPFFSPDGEKIVWRRFNEKGTQAEIWTMNIDGSDQKQITRLKAMSWAPFYHPSGDYIIFTSNLLGFQNFELFVVDSGGTKPPIRVSDLPGFDGLPVFSPKGDELVWSAKSGDGSSQVFRAKWNDVLVRKALGLPKVSLSPQSYQPEIRQSDLKNTIEYLAAEELGGRLTGAPEEKIYTQKIAQLMKGFGLSPFKGSYLHSFDFSKGVELGEGNQLSFTIGSQVLKAGVDWQPLAFSKLGSVPGGEVVFGGYGIVAPADGDQKAYDSYQGMDLKGRWVYLLRYLPEDVTPQRRAYLHRFSLLEHKALVARERGALGVLVVTGPKAKAKSDLAPLGQSGQLGESSFFAISLSNKVGQSLWEGQPMTLASVQSRLDKEESLHPIRLKAKLVGGKTVLNSIRGKGFNVLGVLKGKSSKKQVWIGGHGDHLGLGGLGSSRSQEKNKIHFGADDNASGVAGVLEVAHWLASQKKKPDSDLVFAIWSGEELGNLGSTALLKSLSSAQKKSIKGYLNLDMVGRYEKQLNIQGLGSGQNWATLIEQNSFSSPLSLKTQSDPYLPTDAISFYLQGVPVLSFFTGAHQDYHTHTDTAEKINYQALEQTSQLVSKLALGAAAKDFNPGFQKVKRKSKSMRGGFRIYLGTIPDYTQEKQAGVKISGVIRGAPAEKAGLKGGDLIVELSGIKIENIQDYVYSLQAIKPGVKTQISVLRNGKRQVLEIIPATKE